MSEVMMMSVTAAVALYDDIQRRNADYEINMSNATVLVNGREDLQAVLDLFFDLGRRRGGSRI